MYGVLLAHSCNLNRLRRHSLTAVFGSALVVLSFGIIQYTVLPNNTLTHVGYTRTNGVLPAFFIDDKPDLERAMSTLRDPNSYGSYLIIIGLLAIALLMNKPKMRRLAVGFVALSLLNLWFSFSRSAWIGFIAALSVLLFFAIRDRVDIDPKVLKRLLATGAIGLTVMIFAGIMLRNTYFIQNVVFHADESTVLEDPNELRVRFWRESLQDIKSDPLGSGPGTAGLASIRNNVQGTELNENYYLQIASEVGVLGLGLFLAIISVVGYRLFRSAPSDWLALALLASLVGLLITNFLVHIWSNEVVAYTWWGLTSMLVFRPAFSNSDNKKLNKH